MRRRLEPGAPADAASREEGDALGADEPAGGFGRVARVRVLGQEADEPAVELLVQRREQQRQHGLGDAGARRQRRGERLQPLVLGELADEGVKGRTVHGERPERGFRPAHRIAVVAPAVPALPERRVGAVLLDELVVRAELGQLAVLDDRDAVGVVRGLEPVGDRDDGAARRAPRRASARGGARRADRAARSPRRARACAGRRARAGRARPAAAAAGVSGKPPAPTTVSSPSGSASTHSSASTAASAARSSSSVEPTRASRRLSASVPTKTCCSWVTSATSRRSVSSVRSTSRTPPTSTRPVRAGWIPASRRPSVDLPAPDGPTTATRSPGSRSRSSPCRTSWPSR